MKRISSLAVAAVLGLFVSAASAGSPKVDPLPNPGGGLEYITLLPGGVAKAASEMSASDKTLVHETGKWKRLGEDAACIDWTNWKVRQCVHISY